MDYSIFIEYLGQEYPLRRFKVKDVDEETLVLTIGQKSLENKLNTNFDFPYTKIDHFVEDVYFDRPAEEICAADLDRPYELIIEFTD